MSRHPNRKSISFLWANESFSPHFPISNNSDTEVTSEYLQNLLNDSFVIDGIFLKRRMGFSVRANRWIETDYGPTPEQVSISLTFELFAKHQNTEKRLRAEIANG